MTLLEGLRFGRRKDEREDKRNDRGKGRALREERGRRGRDE